MDKVTRNQDVLGCSEITINIIFKHVQHVRIIWAEKMLRAEKFNYKNLISFSMQGRTEKIAGLWFVTWVSAQTDTMPNVTIKWIV